MVVTGGKLKMSSPLFSGFGGGLVVDYPNSSKAKKYEIVSFFFVSLFSFFRSCRHFLCLFAGFTATTGQPSLPMGLTGNGEEVEQDHVQAAGRE